MSNPIEQLLSRQPVGILDGALATELEARGHVLDSALWSADILVEDPGAIELVHSDYLDAGADCIVSASYQATIPGFEARGQSRAGAQQLLRRSMELARAARDDFWAGSRAARERPLVAASIGPYGAYLADGSEYTGTYGLREEDLENFHRSRFEVLAGTGADLLAFETIPSYVEARALIRLLEETEDSWAWLSFSCRDGSHICDGTDFERVVRELSEIPRLAAIGVNCTKPRYISSLIRIASGVTSKPIIVYPSSGEVWDSKRRSWVEDGVRFDLAAAAEEWVGLGARLIGGCCRTSPKDIQSLRRRLLDQA